MRTCQGGIGLYFTTTAGGAKHLPLLDSPPKLLAAKEHHPAYAEDGDYFSKPSAEDIFECVYEMMQETTQINSLHFNFKRQKP